jgi:hypothetical protein
MVFPIKMGTLRIQSHEIELKICKLQVTTLRLVAYLKAVFSALLNMEYTTFGTPSASLRRLGRRRSVTLAQTYRHL